MSALAVVRGPEPTLPPAPLDSVFLEWMRSELVWLPAKGMGYLPVASFPYDAAYFEKYVGYAGTEMGAEITRERMRLVCAFLDERAELVDVGIGCGAFIEAMATETFLHRGRRVRGYDVNPAAVSWLRERELYRDPFAGPVEAVTLFDALEHIPLPAALLANVSRWVFVCLPVVPGDGPPPLAWKHLRRDEHFWYWTADGLKGWMREQGFACVLQGDIETQLGREDIGTFVFRRIGA